MAEISVSEAIFVNSTIYEGKRFSRESVLDMRTHFKPTEIYQYTFSTRCHALGPKKGNRILHFVRTQFYSAISNLKEILKSKWHLIQQRPLLRKIFKELLIISQADHTIPA